MSMASLVKSVDKGFYQDAEKEGYDYVSFFAIKAADEGVGPDSQELERRENHYLRRFGVKEWQESRADKVRQYAYDTYCLDALFKDAKIIAHGPHADTAQKAWATNAVQSVFPIYYDSRITEGILETDILDALIAESVNVDQGVVEHVELTDTAVDRAVGLAGEFTTFNELTVRIASETVRLKKKGGRLAVSDEALRRARLPVLSRYLRRFGRQIAITETDEALDALLTSITTVPALTTPPTYADLPRLLLAFANGYMPNVAVASTDVWENILNITEVKDPLLFQFIRNGELPSLLGWRWYRWDSTGSTLWTLNDVLVIQRELAAVQYIEGGIRSESDRIINGQFTETVTSLTTGYATLDDAARKLGTGWD